MALKNTILEITLTPVCHIRKDLTWRYQFPCTVTFEALLQKQLELFISFVRGEGTLFNVTSLNCRTSIINEIHGFRCYYFHYCLLPTYYLLPLLTYYHYYLLPTATTTYYHYCDCYSGHCLGPSRFCNQLPSRSTRLCCSFTVRMRRRRRMNEDEVRMGARSSRVAV